MGYYFIGYNNDAMRESKERIRQYIAKYEQKKTYLFIPLQGRCFYYCQWYVDRQKAMYKRRSSQVLSRRSELAYRQWADVKFARAAEAGVACANYGDAADANGRGNAPWEKGAAKRR